MSNQKHVLCSSSPSPFPAPCPSILSCARRFISNHFKLKLSSCQQISHSDLRATAGKDNTQCYLYKMLSLFPRYPTINSHLIFIWCCLKTSARSDFVGLLSSVRVVKIREKTKTSSRVARCSDAKMTKTPNTIVPIHNVFAAVADVFGFVCITTFSLIHLSDY